jgi:hypothetical protein
MLTWWRAGQARRAAGRLQRRRQALRRELQRQLPASLLRDLGLHEDGGFGC